MAQEQSSFSLEMAIKAFERDLRDQLEALDAARREVVIGDAVQKFSGELARARMMHTPKE